MNQSDRKKVIVIGGGAAGFFAAVNAARMNPELDITILEKSKEVLSKVRVSGGGRCNVTHHCFDPEQLARAYPRGGKALKWSFKQFQPKDTVEWFEYRNVRLKTEADGRMFPVTDSSETIINCLLEEARKYSVTIKTKTKVNRVDLIEGSKFKLDINKAEPLVCDRLVIATGGSSRRRDYDWLEQFGHSIVPPVPSLFTFNFRNKIFSDLAGISVDRAEVRIRNTSYKESGPVLITHWGLSGPSVLKLSSRAARELNEMEYRFEILVNWLHPMTEQEIREKLIELRAKNSKKQVNKQDQLLIPARLWERFLELSGLKGNSRWAEVSNKQIHELTQQLYQPVYAIQGKTTYKEEFVTCGGIPLKEVNPNTLESKKIPGLYLAGEVLDIDGITGGFNFQAAWTNGWLAAKAIADA